MTNEVIQGLNRTYHCLTEWMDRGDAHGVCIARCSSGESVRLTQLRLLTTEVIHSYNDHNQERTQWERPAKLIQSFCLIFGKRTIPLKCAAVTDHRVEASERSRAYISNSYGMFPARLGSNYYLFRQEEYIDSTPLLKLASTSTLSRRLKVCTKFY